MISDVVLVSASSLAVVIVLMGLTAALAQRLGRVAVVDVAWGLGFVLVAVVACAVGAGTQSDTWRRVLLLVLVGAWGLRLAWHIRKRAVGHGEDPRYEELLGGTLADVGLAAAIKKVFLVQGGAIWFISLPVQLGGALEVDYSAVVIVGAVIWAVGVVFETVGDAQLTAYRALPQDQKPKVMQTGLWRYTRHPNYFGDACVWWGLWLVGGLGSGWVAGLVTILCPVAMTYFLVFATGARLLEKTMMKREGFPEYAARTSMFFPLPPRSPKGAQA